MELEGSKSRWLFSCWKNGTTRKIENGKYSTNKYIASYVGFAPSSNPRFIAAIRVDEPTKSKTGGKVAAPIFQK